MHTGFQLLCESVPLATLMMVFALMWMRRRRSSATRSHLVLMTACVISILAPLLITMLPKWRVLPSVSSSGQVAVAHVRTFSTAAERHGMDRAEAYPFWFRLAGGIWLAGAGFCVASVAMRHFELRRLLAKGGPVSSTTLALAKRLKSRRGITREVRLMVHEGVGSPFTCGVFKPAIVLPSNHGEMEYAGLRMVLDHEMAHIQRLDALHGLVLQAFVAMWWFHPLAWLVFRSADVLKERACDDLVLLSGEDPRRYAACLGEAVLRAHHHPAFLNMVSTFVRRAPHLARMHAILDPSVDRSDLTPRETWSICAPAILAAVILSSLGFKAASELQPFRPELLTADPGEKIPSLWSDALVPIARGVGITYPVERLAATSQEAAVSGIKARLQASSSPTFNTRSSPRFSGGHARKSARSASSNRTERDLSFDSNPGPENSSITRHVPRFASGARVPSHSVSPIRGGDPVSGGAASVAVPSSDMESFAIGVASAGADAATYGYVAVEDAGVMVYSGIAQPASAEAAGAAFSGHAAAAQDSGMVATGTLDASGVSSQLGALAEGGESAGVPAAGNIIRPEDLGIRNLQPFISPSENGGQLSVSVEVPETSANFWKAEASVDSKSWTSSEAVVSHQFSSGSAPGFLRLTASIVQPVPAASHTHLRLKGKW